MVPRIPLQGKISKLVCILEIAATDRLRDSVQEQGVMATIKHLIGNEQEMWRMYNVIQPAYSANIGELPTTFSGH